MYEFSKKLLKIHENQIAYHYNDIYQSTANKNKKTKFCRFTIYYYLLN